MSTHPRQITSPATHLSPLPPESPLFEVGQEIAYIYNKEDVVPGVVKAVNDEGDGYFTYDLECFIPSISSRIKWKGSKAYKRKDSAELQPRSFLRARASDPRSTFIKVAQEIPNPVKGQEGIYQTHTTIFIEAPRKSRVPSMGEFHTSLIGTFFDPSLFFYKVFCWRAERQVEKETFPAETLLFPLPKEGETEGIYRDFKKAFSRYFKEYHQGRKRSETKWNKVTIQAFLPPSLPLMREATEEEEETEKQRRIREAREFLASEGAL